MTDFTPAPAPAPDPAVNTGVAYERNGSSIAGMILGIISLVIPFVGIVTGIIGLALSGVGLSNYKKGLSSRSARGMAIAGLVCSIVAIIGYVIYWIVLASAASAIYGACLNYGC